ncbi:MAG: 5'-methylthioadenosine/adenosylhomocysteine nucleosidase, partial [Clostridia bacterium]|nr:5'-methylthioadenosine/adenosylhomocysteine nucleosidase [Clostridia bacterium]
MINTGVAGALASELRVGDVAVAENVVQHDMDTSPIGDPVGLISGINMVQIPADEKISSSLKKTAADLGMTCLSGTIASGDQFIADKAKKAYIKDTFSAIACEMEGAAIG